MYEYIITGLMLVVAIIHLLPITGAFSKERLEKLYLVGITTNDMEVLMRHRAFLFGILGSFFAYSAFVPEVQPIAFVAAFVSIVSFLYLALSIENDNLAIRKVVIADMVALICLLAAIILYFTKE